jgi:hypothetical protein
MTEKVKVRLCIAALLACFLVAGLVEGWDIPKGDPPTYVNRAGEIVDMGGK